MNRKVLKKRIFSILAALMLIAGMCGSFPVAVKAENFLFITDIKLGAGKNAYDAMEYEGYHVMTVGLNAGVSEDAQVYLGYKLNEGSPVTNILVAQNEGDTLVADGITYYRAGEADVDAGVSYEGGGYLYLTWDAAAGDPIVGLDVIRTNFMTDEEAVYVIPNDGAEFVRDQYGAPADLEKASDSTAIYLAQIRSRLVKPYISEIALFTGTEKSDAVYKAASSGYNYYLDGDIDDSPQTYSLIAYERTADPNAAIRNITAVSAEMAQRLEDGQIIAGAENKPAQEPETEVKEPETVPVQTEPAQEPALEEPETAAQEGPNEEAGPETPEGEEAAPQEEEYAAPGTEEPYEEAAAFEEWAEEATSSEEWFFEEETSEEAAAEAAAEPAGMTAAAVEISECEYVRISRYQVEGAKPYYLYASKDPKAGNPISMLYVEENKEITETFLGTWSDGYFSSRGVTSAQSYVVNEDSLKELASSMEVYIHAPIYLLSSGNTDAASGSAIETQQQMLNISMLTAKEGLPEGRYVLSGMRTPSYQPPHLVREDQEMQIISGQQASAFSRNGLPVIIIGCVVIAGMIAAGVIIMLKRKKERKSE